MRMIPARPSCHSALALKPLCQIGNPALRRPRTEQALPPACYSHSGRQKSHYSTAICRMTPKRLRWPNFTSRSNISNSQGSAHLHLVGSTTQVKAVRFASKYARLNARGRLHEWHRGLVYGEILCVRPGDTEVYRKVEDFSTIEQATGYFRSGCRYLYGAPNPASLQKNHIVPEVIILGTSNVGKSTFINGLVGKQRHATSHELKFKWPMPVKDNAAMYPARTSWRPGFTQMLNAYGVGKGSWDRKLIEHPMFDDPFSKVPDYSLVLFDAPGYGFNSRAEWGKSILHYIKERDMLRGAVVLLSAEKRFLSEDKWILEQLARDGRRALIVLTKVDKCGKAWPDKGIEMAREVRQHLEKLSETYDGWSAGVGWMPDIYLTCTGMQKSGHMWRGGGMGAVRKAILEMAGYSLPGSGTKKPETKPEENPERISYDGEIVPYDEIKWKA